MRRQRRRRSATRGWRQRRCRRGFVNVLEQLGRAQPVRVRGGPALRDHVRGLPY
jgi:hypothetical protein